MTGKPSVAAVLAIIIFSMGPDVYKMATITASFRRQVQNIF